MTLRRKKVNLKRSITTKEISKERDKMVVKYLDNWTIKTVTRKSRQGKSVI